MQGLPGPQGATGETGKPGEQVRIAENCKFQNLCSIAWHDIQYNVMNVCSSSLHDDLLFPPSSSVQGAPGEGGPSGPSGPRVSISETKHLPHPLICS